MHSSSFPVSLISLPRTRFQTPPLLSINLEYPLSIGFAFTRPLPVTPDDPGATFATKRLTINTDNCTTTYYRHSVAMRTNGSPSVYTVMEASTIELLPSARLFADFAKTPVREYAKRNAEETDAEMRDDLVDSPFIRVQSTSQSSLSDRDSPILRGRLALSGVRESKTMDDSESWFSESPYQASRPMSIAHNNGGEFSLVLGETSNVNTGGFTFDPSLDFFSQEQRTLPANEKQSWAFLWTPPDLLSSFHEYDTPSSSSPVSTFFTPSKPIDIPAPATSKRGEGIAPWRLFSKPYTPYFSAAERLFAARNRFGLLSPSPSTKPQAILMNNVAKVVSYGDTSSLSTSWARHRRLGGNTKYIS